MKKFDFKKSLGQNFLVDQRVIDLIIDFAEIQKEDDVVEVGPGEGALIEGLVQNSRTYRAIEKDHRLIPILRSNFSAVKIVEGDALQYEFNDYDKKVVVVSNVPYSISTDFIFWLIKNRSKIKRASLLLQKEYAERIAANPGTRAFGSLSVFCQLYANMELGDVVKPDAFEPQPKVDSQLISLDFEKELVVEDVTGFEKFVRACFFTKRKTISNSLLHSSILEKDQIQKIFKEVGIDSKIRAEQLSIGDFVQLFRVYKR